MSGHWTASKHQLPQSPASSYQLTKHKKVGCDPVKVSKIPCRTFWPYYSCKFAHYTFYCHFYPSLPMLNVLFFWNFCPCLPTSNILFLLAFLSKSAMVNILVFNGIYVHVYFQWKFWLFWPRLHLLATLDVNTNNGSYVIRGLLLSNLWHRAPPHASSPEEISGTLLRAQEFAIREAIVGTGLEVRIYTACSSVEKVLGVFMQFIVKHSWT